MEYLVISLSFLFAVFILYKRIKRLLNESYQPLYKDKSEAKAFRNKAGAEKKKEF